MRLHRESEYGLRALVHLAKQPPDRIIPLSEIAAAQKLPQSFLAKIFQKFVQHSLLKSYRGVERGYTLAKSPKEITLREVLEAIEGPGLFEQCLFWNNRCADTNPCLLHEEWKKIKPGLIEMVEQTTLEDIAREPRDRARK